MMRACAIGSLMGDAWNKVPRLVNICRNSKEPVKLLAGSYALPVWEWAQKHVIGADYEIERVVDDPDEVEGLDHPNPYCPGYGHIALERALQDMRIEFDDPTIIDIDHASEELNPVSDVRRKLAFKDISIHDGNHTVVHCYTKHAWKNADDVIRKVEYSRWVKSVGLPGEPFHGEQLHGYSFDYQVAEVAAAAGFVGVLSAWTELAGLFNKLQIVVSFTADIPQPNIRAIKLHRPTVEELQRVIKEKGL